MPKFKIQYLFIFLLCFSAQITKAQVTAKFIASDTAGCAPLIIHFTNMSTGATSYSWNLGNSTTSSLTDVSGSYTSAGTYTVTLTAFGSGTSTYSMVIRVYAPPTVSFSASDTAICPGTPITFTSTSIANAWGPMSYNWNFGDGGTSTATSPVYSYNIPGYYNVTLFATNSPGCVGSLSKSSYIHVYNHSSVGFTASTTSYCKAPALVSFTNSTTGAGPFTYKWLFGDGGTSTAVNPTHNYVTAGLYTVVLKATNAKGCIDSLMQFSYINVGSIAASFTLPASACAGAPVSFNNTSSAHISSQWHFGDGGTSAADNPIYTYTASGTYSVKLVIFDGTCYDSVTHTITVSPRPTGSFTSTPVHPCPPTVNVTYNATVPGGTTVAWLFGDGTTGTGTTKIKTYSSSVIDYVDMILTNASGCKDTIQRIDTIFNIYLNTTASPGNGCFPLTVNFSLFAYSVVFNNIPPPFGFIFLSYPYGISSYSWNFNDGSALSTSPSPVHTYTAPGSYNPTCTVVTSNGCTATGTIPVNVGSPATASFTATPRHICAGKSIAFKSTSPGPIDSFFWYFGDGFDTSGPGIIKPVHTYNVPGIFADSLIVKNFGCPSKAFYLIDTVDSPNAVINYSYICIPGNQISLQDYSIGDDSHLWQFGDGATSTIANPIHSYPSLTTYTVTLTTYNTKSGCRDTSSVSVNLAKPVVKFVATKLQLCRDQTDTFTSTTPAGKYKWYVDGAIKDSLGATFIYTFHIKGPHTITLIITDSHGCYDTLTKTNYVLVAKPTDNFSFTPTSGCSPLSVNFTDLSTDVTGASIISYSWAFGDGTTTTTSTPTITHIYTPQGAYVINEIVTDNIGCSDTLTSPTFLNVYKPSAAFNVSTTVACQGAKIHFTNTSTPFISCVWMFGDGATSTVTSPDHAYATAGVYTIKLAITDAHGCTDTETNANLITVNTGPTASFTMSDSIAVCPPLNVHFTNTSTGAVFYLWSFGDGAFSSAISPSEPYLASGYYTVKLTATNATGCSDTAFGHVSIFGYKGAFTYSPLTGCAPLFVHFKATVGTVASIIWDFSDGITSGSTLLDTITHKYTATGTYVPKLILTDPSGCTSSSIGADTIKVDTLIPDFTFIPNPSCQNTSVVFNDASKSLYSSSVSWLWSFGSGVTSTASAPTHTFTASGTFPVTLFVTDGSGCSGSITKNVTVNPTPGNITGVTTLCQGSTSGLTDGTSGGSWSSGNTAIATIGSLSGIVTGIAPGTATITYTVPTGCFITIVVNINPVPVTITGAKGICKGLTTNLSDATAGGVWSSSNTVVATIGALSGIVTGLSYGTTTITYKLITGCLTTDTITITTTPTAISGSGFICLGTTTTLTDPITGGAWSSSNTAVATIGAVSGIIKGISLGTSTITYSLGTGCTVTKTITVVPVPAAITGGSTACAGTPFTLSDPTAGGSWSSINTAIATVGPGTGIVTGLAGGTDTIIYALGTGCSATRSVTIIPVPSITGATAICVGTTTTLSDPTPGGTWSSVNSSVATIGSVTGIVTSHSVGTTTIKYLLPSGCTATMTLTVTAAPPAILGAPGVCVGNTITLSDATTGGIWSSGSTTIATIGSSTGLVNGISSGTVLISYSIGAGCFVFSTIIVNPISPISGAGIVCIGQSITLGDTTLGGTWSSSNTAAATVGIGTGVVTGVTKGTATISYLLTTGCYATHIVTINPLPSAITGTTFLCAGQVTKLSDATPGGTWSTSNTTIATASSTGIITGIAAGTTTVTYIAGGCPATTPFTVYPLPGSIIGNAYVCQGTTTSLSDPTPGGIWSSSASTIATIGSASGLVSGLSVGTTTITYTLTTGCLTTSIETVNPLPSAIIGVSGLCQGFTTTFSDATAGGAWISVNPGIASVGIAGDVFGNSPGITAILYTLPGTGCQASKSVTVNALPAAITGVADICVGQTLTTLTDATPGGTWSSSLAFVGTIDPITGHFYGISGGTTQIDYILGTGCTASTMITVNLPPSPITGFNEVCIGYTAALNDVSPWGAWSSISTTIATIDPVTGIVTGITPGTTTISYTLLTTGCASSITFSVSPLPSAIAGNTYVCLGSSYTFTDLVGGGTWYSTNPGVASVTGSGPYSATVSGMSLGTANIIYTLPAGCGAFISVTVEPLPTVFTVTGGGTFCADDTGAHIYLNGSVKATNYLLYNGGKIATGPVAGSGSALDFGLQKVSGTYTVVATNTLTGCSNYMSGSAIIKAIPLVTPTAKITSLTGDTVCNGVSTTFNGAITNGGPTPIYKWDVNGTVVGSGTTYTFIPANGDLVRFTLTSDVGCARPAVVYDSIKMTVVLPVTPSAALTTSPGDTICDGFPITITAVPTFGGKSPTYTWMKNGVYAGAGPTFTYVPVKGDWVYCRMTSNYMCLVTKTVSSNTVAITVDSPLIPHVTIRANPGTSIALGQSDTLTAVTTDGGLAPAYQWFVNGLPIAGATTNTFISNNFSITKEDSVSCVVTSSGLCAMTTHEWVYISVHNVGVKPLTHESGLTVLPNPNKGTFLIKGTLGTINDEEVSLEITDLLGQVVYKDKITARNGTINEQVLLGDKLANSMYILSLRSGTETKVFHIVVER